MISILIADKYNVVRLGVEQIVLGLLENCCTIDFASDTTEVLRKTTEKMYDIIVTDLNMSGIKGILLIKKILSINAKARIIILTANGEVQFAERCFHAGARAFIHKGASSLELAIAIQAVIQAPLYISDKQKNIFATSFLLKQALRKQFPDLSEQELEVALLLLYKLDVIGIAYAMGISVPAAKSCQKRVYEKLNVNNQMELANIASKYSLSYNA
jgi:DNA-binding NarL/FixJ family response regulator